MNHTIRPAEESDYESIAEVLRKTLPGFLGTAESLRESDRRPLVAGPKARFIAEQGSNVVGVAQYRPNVHECQLSLLVTVLPSHRRQGIGHALFEVVNASAQAHQPQARWAEVSEADSDSFRFAEKHGFREHTRVFESRFDLTRFASEDALPALPESFRESSRQDGFEIQDLAHTSLEDAHRQFYKLYFESLGDVPNLPKSPAPSFEAFQKSHLDPTRYPADGVILAVVGEEVIGFSQMMLHKSLPTLAIIAMTGCKPGYRGRGIATTLKIAAMRWAKRRGIQTLSTWNDALNAPILAINEKLGFLKRPGMIILRR
ncbi:MAG: GNAT family N-acetyltransferase [Oligoflexia bacterium]|nr:GNAT family N-acetyltransferase [Oligoflexia bacterium]